MIRLLAALFLLGTLAGHAETQAELAKSLGRAYGGWRQAMIKSDTAAWQAQTASHRRAEVRNRLVSEKRPFPAAVFDVPAPPPSLDKLKAIHVSRKGNTARLACYGKIDFGIGGEPTENIIVLSFVAENRRWKYDRADFVNLAALPEVRDELAKGDLTYVRETPEFQATGVVPPTPAAVPTAKYIAKVYAFCPGREVHVTVNGVSKHRFANAKEAEVVLGGARDGRNNVSFTVAPLEGGAGKEAFTVRVYLMSEIEGTQPIKAYEYQAEEGKPVRSSVEGSFEVDAATAKKLVP